jgi:hypothetical protein
MTLTPMRQSATWKANNGGYPVTYTSTTIKCRYQPKQKTIMQANGTMKLTQAVIRCAEAVKANDRIVYNNNDSLVILVNGITGIGGDIIEYEVYL